MARVVESSQVIKRDLWPLLALRFHPAEENPDLLRLSLPCERAFTRQAPESEILVKIRIVT
jgi:hypothetical protein